ncbi:YlmH/Sll1252 family protein [Fodinisporobacter ferrooxydans]|uniref:YlmH/Sll1252 family protein n=1 Tax=Fodinisporobacter ferrooxydans TaxID=2901836 RepID=A0ABY4CF66_9BACL|nr:YlmH/Sll1252 family protein [Alicyclobacillaceae bacterium MYW30-H2]
MLERISVHFRPEEKPFLQRVEEWLERATRQHRIEVTHFLNPRQANILQIVGRTVGDANIGTFGGPVFAERVRAVIVPSYSQPELADARLAAIRMHVAGNGKMLGHGDYLGALLGAGIVREKIGDIYVREDGCDVIVAEELVAYFLQQMSGVGRFPVELAQIPLSQVLAKEPETDTRTVTVASMRLDAVASEGFRISRGKMAETIRSGACQLNWQVTTDPSQDVFAGDVISVRGLGRMRILELGEQRSKKGRLFVTIGNYV